MQVKVPKFIEIEDKIAFGMTWKQFLALGIGIGGGIIAYMIFDAWLGVPLLLIGIGFGLAFSFAKWNERSFSVFLGAVWAYFYNPHRLIWKRLPSRVRFEKQSASGTTSSRTASSSKKKKVAAPVEEEEVQASEEAQLSEIAKLLDV